MDMVIYFAKVNSQKIYTINYIPIITYVKILRKNRLNLLNVIENHERSQNK